jgi:hypothetical protein
METGPVITLGAEAYTAAEAGAAALGQSITEWVENAVRVAARRRHISAYMEWEKARRAERGLDELDDMTVSAISP